MIDRISPIPLYFQIETHLKERIESGDLKPGDKLASELELSRQMDVSPMTVRQAYKALEKDGYLDRRQGRGTFVSTRSPAPTGFRKKRGVDLGILMKTLSGTDLFGTELLHGIEQACHASSYSTHLLSSNGKDLQDKQNYLLQSMFENGQIDGVLAIGVFGADELEYLHQCGIPCVFIDTDYKESPIHSVLLDDEGYTAAWTTRLLEAGLHEVALLCGERNSSSSNIRRRGDRMIKGFRAAFKTAGLPCKDEWIFSGSGNELTRLKIAEEFLATKSRPSAVLVNGDALTSALLHARQRRRASRADDLLIINYGDSPHSRSCQVPKPLQQMGAAAVDLLRKLIKKSPNVPRQVVVPFDVEAIQSAKLTLPDRSAASAQSA